MVRKMETIEKVKSLTHLTKAQLIERIKELESDLESERERADGLYDDLETLRDEMQEAEDARDENASELEDIKDILLALKDAEFKASLGVESEQEEYQKLLEELKGML